MGASGHGFHFNSTDKIALSFVLCGIFIVPNYKNKLISNDKVKTLISIVALIIAIGTIIVGILVLKDSTEFKFGDDINRIVIGLFYLIPLIFIIINGIIINGIVVELRQ
jgi:nitric oxide reductase large subunit|tara:strand:+ start:173 stop:499 length:327 start_codon:yes stop_codon:yes gene_type:complete